MIYIDDECKKEMLYWEKYNKQVYKKICELLYAIESDPFKMRGKPEPLKYKFSGVWSSSIDNKNRLLYSV